MRSREAYDSVSRSTACTLSTSVACRRVARREGRVVPGYPYECRADSVSGGVYSTCLDLGSDTRESGACLSYTLVVNGYDIRTGLWYLLAS